MSHAETWQRITYENPTSCSGVTGQRASLLLQQFREQLITLNQNWWHGGGRGMLRKPSLEFACSVPMCVCVVLAQGEAEHPNFCLLFFHQCTLHRHTPHLPPLLSLLHLFSGGGQRGKKALAEAA